MPSSAGASDRRRVGEGERERVGARPPTRGVGNRVPPLRVGTLHGFFGGAQCSRLAGELGRDRRLRVHLGPQLAGGALDRVGLGPIRFDRRQLGIDLRELGAHLREVVGDRPGTRVGLVDVALRVGQLGLGLTPEAGRGQLARRERPFVVGAKLRGAGFRRFGVGAHRRQRFGIGVDREQLLARPGGFGHEGLDHPFVGDRRQLPFEPAPPLGDEVGEPTAAFPQRLGTREQVGHVVAARHRQRPFRREHRLVERGQPDSQILLLACQLRAGVDPALLTGLQAVDLTARQVQRDRPKLGDDAVVTPGRVGLALERAELASHLAEEVREAQEVALGRLEPPLGLLAALAELQDRRPLPR